MQDTYLKVLPKVFPKVGIYLIRYGESIFPPVLDKLVLWAPGRTILGSQIPYGVIDEDYTDPPGEYGIYRDDRFKTLGDFPLKIEPNGDTITGDWDTTNATYVIDPDHAIALAADALEGPFLNVPRTQAEIEAYCVGKASVFFCVERGYKLYNDILVGQELINASLDCS